MIRKLSLIVVGVCLSASALADVGGRVRAAAPKNPELLHAKIFDFLKSGEVREKEVKNDKGEMEMVFERKDQVICVVTVKQASGRSSAEAVKCTNSKGESIEGPVAKEIVRLMPSDGTSAATGEDVMLVEKQKVICVAHQTPGADNSVNTSFNCL